MPKLQHHALEANQVKIENAALNVFTRQGYHGTSVREIADEAGISLGNIYNYYKTKEQIFESLVQRYDQRMAQLQRKTLTPLLGSLEPENLVLLSKAVREIVYAHPDYWRLMYIDVVEFGNRHFAHIFRDFSVNLKSLRPDAFHQKNGKSEIDKTVAFTAIYLQFFTYYLVEKLFGGQEHLGMSDDKAIAQLIRICTAGLGNGAAKKARTTRRK